MSRPSRRCVVTGGAGFIGSHLVDRLVADGHSVVVVDNLATGRKENLAQHEGQVRLCLADVADCAALREPFEGAEWVFHLAALADIVPSVRDPMAYHRANVDGTASVLEASRGAGAERFVYAASSSCYGLAEVLPTPETAALAPQYPYALTKLVGEQYALHWHKIYGLPVVSLRFFNVYGPRSRTSGTYGAVFGVFLAQKLAGKPFTVVGDGTQSRDFTFVTDIVDALVRAAASGIAGEVFNVGTGRPQTIHRLVELLGGERTYVPKRPGEPDVTQADATKIARALGWAPNVSFEEGVRVMLENIEAWRSAPVWSPDSVATATADWFRYLGKAGR
jgi:UDP-glucose 4-epimerase